MIMKKRFIKSLVATGAATMLLITFTAFAANTGNQSNKTIKGVDAERPVYQIQVTLPEETTGGGPDHGPGEAVQETPAIYIDNGKYSPEKSRTSAVTAGKITDTYASGIKISATEGTVGGVYVTGPGSQYSLYGATIELSGDVDRLGGRSSGVCVDDYATLTIRNSNITTYGARRNAIAPENNGLLKVYNSTITAHGNPFTPDITNTGQKQQLEIDGNTRTLMITRGMAYLYHCTIIANGWAALATEPGWLYFEANNCTVKTITSGYGIYAHRTAAHNLINNCDFDVASMATIVEAGGDITFNNTKAKCGTYFALMHCVNSTPDVVGTLNVNGGEIACKSPGVIVKSANADINFNDVKMATESGILLRSQVTVDPIAAECANTNGMDVYGIHATFKDMDVAGDIIHGDKESRDMWVDLESATLNGAINDAYVTIDADSKWIATGNSNVTIVGSIDVTQIDAPRGVTINAVAGESGTYTLASGGTLILKAS
ncbi:hypothetical protein OAC89_03000 [Deltaproteobacteria bacterium]|nr:hypothetical protein [Deltaproteobacteria bacterium]